MRDVNPVEVFSHNVLERCPDLKIKGKSLFNGTMRVSSFKQDFKDDDLIDSLGLFRFMRSQNFNAQNFDQSVLAYLKEAIAKKEDEKANVYLTDEESAVDPKSLKIYVDVEADTTVRDADKFIVDRESHKMIKDISVLAYKHLIGEETYNKIRGKFPLAKKAFDPYLINNTFQDRVWKETLSFGEVKCINECVHPDWRYNRDLTVRLTPEEVFFIESSFKSKEDLQYYIDAAYHTIIDKMWSYIMLFGIKGTGKTTLIEMLIPCIGKDNYRKAPQNALQKEFNGFKKNKRLVLMDEMVANTDKAINILKSDANKEFNVEEKNQVAESVQNFVSMWIATNNISDWKFTHDERRFSVLELVEKTTLERGISDEWMSEFSQKIETEEFANAFFNYLEKRRSSIFNTMKPYKSKLFYSVVYESLASWQAKIVDEITIGEKRDKIQISSLFEDSDRYAPTTHKKIIDFLDNYRHLGHKLGMYQRERSVKSSFIIPTERYRAKERTEFDLDKEL
jgi:hypothetical protein